MAVFEYEDDGQDWCPPKVAQCRELLAAISAGTAEDLLAKWKVKSLQNLGLKQLLQPPRVAKNKTPPLSAESSQHVPPVIPADPVRTAALFSRQLVRPSIFEMVKRALPGFRLIEQRGSKCRFIRAGPGGLFDYVIFSRDWGGAIRVELAASYDSTWKGGVIGQLDCSIGLANLRLGLNRMQLSHRDVYNKSYYIYGRSIEEFQKQIHELETHLARYAPQFFLAARQVMQSRKLVQFGIKQVVGNPLTEAEKAALKQEENAYTGKPVANSRFVELKNALEQFVEAHPDIPKEERDNLFGLASELLFANLAPSAVLPQKKDGENRIWKWFRRRNNDCN